MHQYLHPTSCHRAVYEDSIAYGQAIRLTRICSDENDLQRNLVSLESWSISRDYGAEKVRPEIQKINLIDRANLLIKKPKHQENSITLVLTFHQPLNIVFNVLKSAHRFAEKSPAIKAVLPKPPSVAFRNPKTSRDKLVRSKIRENHEEKRGNFPCGHSNCEICEISEPGKEFKSTVSGEVFKMNFHFDCNSICVVYLLTCRICKKQYTGSTITRSREQFILYKSNLKLYGEGRRDFKQKTLLEHFYSHDHHRTHNDMIVQIIDFCDPNDQEKRENFWMHKLRTLYHDGLNHKKVSQ